MYSVVSTVSLQGIEAIPIKIEADVSAGLPSFEMVGFLSSEVKEAKNRVRTALKNSGYPLPAKRITVSFSPAGVRKSGCGFDLAIAIAILVALGFLPQENVQQIIFIGELSLSGRILPIHGVLPMLSEAAKLGYQKSIVSNENMRESSFVENIENVGVSCLKQVVSYLSGYEVISSAFNIEESRTDSKNLADFSQVNGQKFLKRACEVAVSGRHNFMMVGPPGAGKTMIAKCIPSILPPMSKKEQMEVSKIYSVCGMFDESKGLMTERPFRNPHHTITAQGLAGGGRYPKPGEISLAHAGVLFLDELAEFQKSTLEILRQPMEEKQIKLVRAAGSISYPADFMLVAAMNPCNCGYYPDMQKCRCSEATIEKYLSRISQPFLDRIDICVEAKQLEYDAISKKQKNESSSSIRERVVQARSIQNIRYQEKGYFYNSQVPAQEIAEICQLTKEQEKHMGEIYQKLNLSARSYHKILRVARTIADLDGSTEVSNSHLHEAVCYRSLDKKVWGRGL